MALFEEYTEETILEELLSIGNEKGVDTREGSVFYDAVAAVTFRMAEIFSDLTIIAEQSSIVTATGEQLDILAEQFSINQIHREAPVKAIYELTLTPETDIVIDYLDLEDGDVFIVDGLFFNLRISEEGVFTLEASEYGIEYNSISSGTNAVPDETVDYLASAVVGELITPGVDEEDDDDFRLRIQEMLSAPAENGNAQQYKTWCEEIEGIGKATIYPLFAGPNTVKAVLTNSSNLPCSSELVAKVQEHIDPMTEEYAYIVDLDGVDTQLGDGRGEGAAPIGAHFLAVSAQAYEIDISISNMLINSEHDTASVKSQIETAIEDYISSLIKSYTTNIVLKHHRVVSIIASIDGVDDFDSVSINNVTGSNVTVPTDKIPVLNEVTYETEN